MCCAHAVAHCPWSLKSREPRRNGGVTTSCGPSIAQQCRWPGKWWSMAVVWGGHHLILLGIWWCVGWEWSTASEAMNAFARTGSWGRTLSMMRGLDEEMMDQSTLSTCQNAFAKILDWNCQWTQRIIQLVVIVHSSRFFVHIQGYIGIQ